MTAKKKWNSLIKDGIVIRIYWHDIIWLACIAIAFIICLELFYRMIHGDLDHYRSDFPYYAQYIIDMKGFRPDRLVELVSIKLHAINQSTMEFNILAALVVALTIAANYLVVSFYVRRDGMGYMVPRYAVQLVSLLAFFTGPVYFPFFHKFYQKGSFSSYAWHSPTQQLMTLVSLIALLCFLKMFLDYKNGVSAWWWAATAVTMLLSASVKPSFIICMVPSTVVLFIIELLAEGKEGFKERFFRLFAMGCSLIPAGLFIIWLNTKEFGDETLSGDTAHIIFGLEVLRSKSAVLNMFIFGMLFTLVVCVANWKRFRDNKYFLAALLFAFGVLQWALLAETGDRAADGNFTWGRIFATYYLTLLCLTIGLENIYNKESIPFRSGWAKKAYLIAAGLALAMSLSSQGVYFMRILMGQSYWR